MTCVTGHLTNVDFTPAHKNWYSPPPESLFTAPIVTTVSEVGFLVISWYQLLLTLFRIKRQLLKIWNLKRDMPKS
jgi:hypothetical protein